MINSSGKILIFSVINGNGNNSNGNNGNGSVGTPQTGDKGVKPLFGIIGAAAMFASFFGKKKSD